MEEDNVRFSFNDEVTDSKVTKEIKLDKSRSLFAKKSNERAEQKIAKEQFQEKAETVHKQMEDYRVEAVNLGQEFNKLFASKVLSVNKGPLEKSFEKEVLTKLITFAMKVNNDENEPMIGQGSVSMITLLMNTVIKLRDRNNDMEFEIQQLKKAVEKIKTNM